MNTGTICHNIKRISVRVAHYRNFVDTRFTFTDDKGSSCEFSAFSEAPLTIEHEPEIVVNQQEAA